MPSPANVAHGTIVVDRLVEVDTGTVFAAFADPAARQTWSAPSNTAMFAYLAADFRVGGMDRFICGSRDDPQYSGTVSYLGIAPPQWIDSSEVIEVKGTPIFASLVTTEFIERGGGTLVRTTSQVTSWAGPGPIEGVRHGTASSMDNLARYLGEPARM